MEGPTIREAVAVFDDPGKLENAVSELQSSGIDRSELSFLAHTSLADSRRDDSRRLADDPATPREPAVTDTDIRQVRILGTSLAAAVAGLIAAGFTVATGGIAAATIAAAAAAGGRLLVRHERRRGTTSPHLSATVLARIVLLGNDFSCNSSA